MIRALVATETLAMTSFEQRLQKLVEFLRPSDSGLAEAG